jgi:hypothetical protein
VPTTSFWHAVNELERSSDLVGVEFGQAVGVAVTLVLMIFTARRYWATVRHFRSLHANVAERK